MADAVSDSDVPAANPPPKRRRILDPAAIVPVPVYSNKVSSSLQLKPVAPVFTENKNKDASADGADDNLWSELSSRGTTEVVYTLSDSEDEEGVISVENKTQHCAVEAIRCPSPPAPESPVQIQSRHVKKKLSEIDKRLRAVSSVLSPPQDSTRSRRRRGSRSPAPEDDDVIIMSPSSDSQSLQYSIPVREIPLKIRCRTDVHKIPVLSTTPLKEVLTQLSIILNVPPTRLLLMREDMDLPTGSTVSELGLCITDILECVVMAAEDKGEADTRSSITVRLQSKDRDSSQEFTLGRDAPLGSIFSQYLSRMSPRTQGKVRFHFDGSKVTHSQTPSQLDMEDGDIIEVWI